MVLRLLIMLLIGGGAYMGASWLDKLTDTSRSRQIIHSDSLPDYYMKNFIVNGTDLQGKPRYQLNAESMQHFTHDDHADLIKPKLKFYSRIGPPWHVESQTGHITSEGKLVTLFGEVRIDREKTDTIPPVVIHTRDLKYNSDTNFVWTENKADYKSGISHANGVGIKLNFDENQLSIENKVKGFFVPIDVQAENLSGDRGKPMDIKANSVDIDEIAGRSVYKGNVVFVQGSTRITGQIVTITHDESRKLKQVIALGKPSTFKQRPENKTEDVLAKADKIVYFAQQDKLQLNGNSNIIQGSKNFSSQNIFYNIKTESVTTEEKFNARQDLRATPDSKKNAGRVEIILDTNDNSK